MRRVYVCVEGWRALRDHLAMREACRSNREYVERYAQRKRELSTIDWQDPDGYCKAKTETIIEILKETGFDEGELEQMRRMNEAISK